MTIDWITVSAQVVNFLILVWLLKRFLYQPVMNAMERRERRITERLQEAQEREQKAGEAETEFHRRRDELDSKRSELLRQARADAEDEKHRLLEDARADVAESREQWRRQVEAEKQEFLDDLRRHAARSIQAAASRAIGDLAGVPLQEQIIATFLERLRSLDAEARKALAHASGPMQVTTAFELDSAARGRLTRAIHEQLAADIDVDYAQADELICGIALKRGGQRLSWNLADYLEELGEHVEEAFNPAAGGRVEV